MKVLKELVQELDRCVRCGTCRGVCPTFGVILREAASARGKVSLAKSYVDGDIALSRTFIRHISECVLCGACEEVCANDVPVPDIIIAARGEKVRSEGLPFTASAVMKGLNRPHTFMSLALRVASKFQPALFKKVPKESGMRRRFPVPLVDKDRLVPPLAGKFMLDTLKKSGKVERGVFVSRSRDSKVRVGFFAGCLTNYISPNIGIASIEVLNRVGADVFVPLKQVCCGMPALGMGDVKDAKSLALRNLDAFEGLDLDFITTSCATCGEALKRRFKDLLLDAGDPATGRRVEEYCGKVRDINALLVNELGIGDIIPAAAGDESRKVATYHDPCHLRRSQGIKEEPRELLEMAGLRIKEMNHPCRCCGLGGSFNLTHYGFSMEIGKKKAEDIDSTGAEIAATACPGCILQIKDGLHHVGSTVKVVHVIELLAGRLRGGEGMNSG